MRLLIITQKVDQADPVLGFFVGWIKALATKFEKVTVICLERGEFNLLSKVKILSLGKEAGPSRHKYLVNFYKYLWRERGNYDAVLVHMNQEYVNLAGWWWWLSGKRVYLWRNHGSGSWLTNLAVTFCTKVFCTSRYSYTAKYKKTTLMPIGVDTNLFKLEPGSKRAPNSILSLGRIAPSKNLHILLDALAELKREGTIFSTQIIGDALSKDQSYLASLKKQVREIGLAEVVEFKPGVQNDQTPELYNQAEVFVNLSHSGMYDKTIFEALACGCLVLASNDNLLGQLDARQIITDRSAGVIAQKLLTLLSLPVAEKENMIKIGLTVAQKNNLTSLVDQLVIAMA